MFPRIIKQKKNNKKYEYLVISRSIRKNGKSTTQDIFNLGNISKFKRHDIVNLVDGLIRIFQLDEYCLSQDIEVLESLTYGPIMLWQKLWQKMNLTKLIIQLVSQQHVSIEVEKYAQLMVINRCIEPSSKLAITRWFETTCYKELQEFSQLPLDVNYFYRSMDYLVEIKDELEKAIYEQLKNLFSINVKLTFYDITSSFFYGDKCQIAKHGYSRDKRSDLEQIVVGVVTSYEGYPIKHYVFDGNTADSTTVIDVVKELKHSYHLNETVFVGDRGMITKLNLDTFLNQGYDYIMGVKLHQDSLFQMLLKQNKLDWSTASFDEQKKLKILEHTVSVKEFLLFKTQQILAHDKLSINFESWQQFADKIASLTDFDKVIAKDFRNILQALSDSMTTKVRVKLWTLIKRYSGNYERSYRFICCLNTERQMSASAYREKKLEQLSEEMDKLFANIDSKKEVDFDKEIGKIFAGFNKRFQKFFKFKNKTSYSKNLEAIAYEEKYDGVFVLQVSRDDITADKTVSSYKNLQEVETLFDDFKNFVDIRPIRHHLEKRVRGHVLICILALLLKRIFEIDCLQSKSVTQPLEEIDKVKLVRFKVKFSEKEERYQIIPKITNLNPMQKNYFKAVGIKNPMNIEKFMW